MAWIWSPEKTSRERKGSSLFVSSQGRKINSVQLRQITKFAQKFSLSSAHLKLTTLLVSQSLISPLKYLALKNIFSILTTLLTRHLLISPLKVVAWNILLIFSTLLTSQSEIFSLKGIMPESPYLYTNNCDMSVIWEVRHEFMG